MRKKIAKGIGIGIIIILLPCFITVFMNGDKKITEKENIKAGTYIICQESSGQIERIDTEQYLIGAIAAYLPENCEDETYKVMAVILRTYLTKKVGEKEEIEEGELTIGHLSAKEMEQAWGENFEQNYKRISQAVHDTAKEVLTYEEELIEPYFHDVSAGRTNTWEESPYLQSVESEADRKADNYLSFISYTPEEFWNIVEKTWDIKWEEEEWNAETMKNLVTVVTADTPYVKEVQIKEKVISAEEFQNAFGLSSTAFLLEEYNKKLRIITKGAGHGYGVSLYGANAYALEGKNYKWILEKYYTNIVISHE